MNILITCGGSVVSFGMVNDFKKQGHNVITCDMNDETFRNYTILPPETSGYISSLLLIYEKKNIECIIPLSDLELLNIVKNQIRFPNNKMIYSPIETIETCIDKHLLYNFLDSKKILLPETYINISNTVFDFPIIIKPSKGSGSRNIYKVYNFKDLQFFYNYVTSPVVQKFISGDEYTIDALVDKKGNIIYIVPRKRLVTNSGFSVVCEINNDSDIIIWCEKIIKLLKIRGPCMFQCIRNIDGDIFFTEVTPRFAGSVSFIKGTGINPVQLLCDIINDKKVNRQDFDYVKGFRYYKEFFVKPCRFCGGAMFKQDIGWECNRCVKR